LRYFHKFNNSFTKIWTVSPWSWRQYDTLQCQ